MAIKKPMILTMRMPTVLLSTLLGTTLLALPTQSQSTPVELGPAEPLPQSLYTFNTHLLTAIAFNGLKQDGPQMEMAVRTLRPYGLRFPGGTIANNYLWKEDSFSDPANDKTDWAADQIRIFRKIGLPYDLPGYARLCKQNHLMPIWVLNVYEETPDSVLQLMDKLDSLGLPVQKVELANEPYWDGRSMMNVWDYIKFCQPLAEALKKNRPGVQIGACFGPLGQPSDYEAKWNAVLAKPEHAWWYDAIVYHEYYGGQGIAMEAGSQISLEDMLHPEVMFDEPAREFAQLLPDKPIWYTEWNIGTEGVKQWGNKGANQLFKGCSYVSLIENRQAIDLACYHDLYGDQFGTFEYDRQEEKYKTNSSWQFFRLLGTVFAGADQLRPTEFPTSDLRGFATQKGEDVRLFVVNRSDQNHSITLPADLKGDLVQLKLDCTPTEQASTSVPQPQPISADQKAVTLPAYSISLIGSRESVVFKVRSVAGINLFPRRPDLTLWYEPYASQQPHFDNEGIYTVDLGQFTDKPLAVVKMNIESLKLSPGEEYSIEFDVKGTTDGGIVVKMPDADDNSPFVPNLKDFLQHRFVFKYDPTANQNEISFVISQDMIAKSGQISFRNFRIGPVK